jgi:hypothetical protein
LRFPARPSGALKESAACALISDCEVCEVLAAVLSYMALAGSLEADGDRAGAAEAYAHVVRLWKNADPHLQPVVRQARDALARLTGER